MARVRFLALLIWSASCGIFPLVQTSTAIAEEPKAEKPSSEDVEFFEKKIRPLLVQHCLDCHSDAKKIRGGLKLDSRAGWQTGGDSGDAILPGKPEESLLLDAVKYQDEYLKMPPKGKLPDASIADLEEWIRRGAPDPRTETTSATTPASTASNRDYWSYQPIREIQNLGEPGWIDRLIGDQLAAHHLNPLPPADREVLARRIYFDLWGLPPTVEQIDEFVNDAAPDAWPKLVDRLLASPHFGERWGRHWLDVVRFGESITLRGTIFPEAWRYRDYVIDAFNTDRPYDRFLREQLAGDLLSAQLPEGELVEKQRALIAATFLQLGNTNLEEQDKQQLEMDFIDEQLDVTGKAFLGQTLGCARCHDHKFDPISTKDYYSLAAIFKSVQTLEHANISKWIELKLPLESAEEEKFAKQETELAAVESRLKSMKEELKKLTDPGNAQRARKLPELPGIVVDDVAAKKVGEWVNSTFALPYLESGYLHDQNRDKGAMTLTFQPMLPKDGTYEVRLAYTPGTNRSTKTPVTVFSADGEKTIPVNQKETPPLDGMFLSLGTYRFETAGQCFVIVSNEETDGHVIADAVQFLPTDPGIADATASIQKQSATTGEKNPEATKLEAEMKELNQQMQQLKKQQLPRPMVMGVRESNTITQFRVHIRGSVHNQGEVVPRAVPQVFDHLPAPVFPFAQSGRLELAQWMTNPDHPLTSRVMANRVWYWLFGAGLVRSVDNFGTTGELPTHPELLDGLARRFVTQGWSVKQLVREIVLTEAYQRAGGENFENDKIDVQNHYLWRANRRRLDGESLRDAMLLCGGNLDLTPGGPGFQRDLVSDYEFQPQGTRRSVYLPIFRNRLPEIPELFDLADPSLVTGARANSTIAPQALLLMNHPFIREQSEKTAARLITEVPEVTPRIERATRLILGRRPTDLETDALQRYLNAESQAGSDELKSWTGLIQSLFASADFRYVD